MTWKPFTGLFDEQLRAENAALKEQNETLDAEWREVTAAKFFELENTIAQQAEAIRWKDVLLSEIAKQTPEKPDYWSSCGQCERNAGDAEDALAIQPSPEILQARDERVADSVAVLMVMKGVISQDDDIYKGIYAGEWRKYL